MVPDSEKINDFHTRKQQNLTFDFLSKAARSDHQREARREDVVDAPQNLVIPNFIPKKSQLPS